MSCPKTLGKLVLLTEIMAKLAKDDLPDAENEPLTDKEVFHLANCCGILQDALQQLDNHIEALRLGES